MRTNWQVLAKQAYLVLDEIWFERGSLGVAVRADRVWTLATPEARHSEESRKVARVLSPTDEISLEPEIEPLSTDRFEGARMRVVDLLPKIELAAHELESKIAISVRIPQDSPIDEQIHADFIHDIARASAIGAILIANEEHASPVRSLSDECVFTAPNVADTPWSDLLATHGSHQLRAYRAAFWAAAAADARGPRSDCPHVLESITADLLPSPNRRTHERLVLRQGVFTGASIQWRLLTIRNARRLP